MEACERINQDMMALPFLTIAVKEKQTSTTFYELNLKELSNDMYKLLSVRPSRSYYSGLFSKDG